MSYAPSVTEANVLTVLGNFLTAILPAPITIVRGQTNRVAEPATPDFCVMWPLLQNRLKTNEGSYADVAFTGAIAGTALTVSHVLAGSVAVGQQLTGQGVAAGTVIVSGSGTSWVVSPIQTVSSTVMQAGTQGILQGTQVTVQVDVHGPASGDNAQVLSTLFRDEFADDFFAASGYDVAALYSEDPRQVPFLNAEQQYEERWVVDCVMQTNPVVTVQQQFADVLTVEVVSVEAAYPL